MEREILLNLKCLSIEIVVIAFIVFALTSILKLPIKKFTSKFDENKRKAINTVIVFIPMILSVMLTALYFGIAKNDWFSNPVVEACISVYVLSISAYAIFSKLVVLIKGVRNGEIEVDSEQVQNAMNTIEKDISSLAKVLSIDQSELETVNAKIEKLNLLKETILGTGPLKEVISQLSELQAQREKIENEISITQKQINKEN